MGVMHRCGAKAALLLGINAYLSVLDAKKTR